MEKKSSISLIIGILVLAVLGYVVFSDRNEEAEKRRDAAKLPPVPPPRLEGEVSLGAVLPLSGERAAFGTMLRRAAELAVEEINVTNGVGGKKLVVTFEDGMCHADEATTVAGKLVNENKAQFLLGGGCAEETLGIATVANEKKAVVVSPAGGAEILAKGGDFVFRLAPSDVQAAKVAARYAARTLKARRAAVVGETRALPAAFTNEFRAERGVVTLDLTFAAGTTDFRAQAERVKNARVDVVYIASPNGAMGAAFVQALKDVQVTARVLSSSVLLEPNIINEHRDALAGVIGFSPFFDPTNERADAFLIAYRARYGESPASPLEAAAAHAAMYLARDLFIKDGQDGVKMQKTLSTLQDWSGGALGDITLDPAGDSAWNSYNVLEVKEGAVADVGVFKME